jgi:AraC-like DNA-binding protein
MKKSKHVSPAVCQRLPVSFIAALLESVAAIGIEPARILRAAGLRRSFGDLLDQHAEGLAVEEFATINRLCNTALRELHREQTGEICMTEEQFRLLCQCLIGTSTLRESIDITARFFAMFEYRTGRASLEEDGSEARLCIGPERKQPTAASYVIDLYGLAVMQMLYGWLIDQPLRLASVRLAYPSPQSNEIGLGLFDCELRFDQPANMLCFDAQQLRQPTLRTHGELAELLRLFPYDLTLRSYRSKPLGDQVYLVMMSHYGRHRTLPSIDAVARTFGVTDCTLRRRLAEESTAYSKIRRRCQLNAAADFLRRADMTVAEIAHLSSFSDPTAFRRAFRHWTGKSPTAYRHEVLGVTAHVPVGVSCDWGTADS